MSLMQLLTVTRSIKTVKNQPSPYRMKQDHLLPKFSAEKPEIEEVAPERGPQATAQAEAPLRRSPQPKRGFFRRWFLYGRKAKERNKGRLPVQTELRLDAVRVVRNDFSESDVFAGGLSPRSKGEAQTRAATGQWWLRIQTRLFPHRRKPS